MNWHTCEHANSSCWGGGGRRTKLASLVASRSTGMKMRTKNRESTAKPRAARVCGVRPYKAIRNTFPKHDVRGEFSYDDSVVPGEDGQLIEPSNQVPASCDVAGHKYPEGQDGEGVHRIRRPYCKMHMPD